jgi:hypothetical protein
MRSKVIKNKGHLIKAWVAWQVNKWTKIWTRTMYTTLNIYFHIFHLKKKTKKKYYCYFNWNQNLIGCDISLCSFTLELCYISLCSFTLELCDISLCSFTLELCDISFMFLHSRIMWYFFMFLHSRNMWYFFMFLHSRIMLWIGFAFILFVGFCFYYFLILHSRLPKFN